MGFLLWGDGSSDGEVWTKQRLWPVGWGTLIWKIRAFWVCGITEGGWEAFQKQCFLLWWGWWQCPSWDPCCWTWKSPVLQFLQRFLVSGSDQGNGGRSEVCSKQPQWGYFSCIHQLERNSKEVGLLNLVIRRKIELKMSNKAHFCSYPTMS